MTAPANIGPRGCRRRGTMGWAWLVSGAVYVVVLTAFFVATLEWYALAFVPFFLGALGYFQAREQTCVFLAAVGRRNMDGGAERISDHAELARDRRQALRVWLRAAAVALALTVLACAFAVEY